MAPPMAPSMAPPGHLVALHAAIGAERRGCGAARPRRCRGRLCLRRSPPRGLPHSLQLGLDAKVRERRRAPPLARLDRQRPPPASSKGSGRRPAGLPFPARPAPRRRGRPGKMAAPVSPLVTARCLLRASARAAGLRRGQCRRGATGRAARSGRGSRCAPPRQGSPLRWS